MRKRPPEISDGLCFIEEYQTTPYGAPCNRYKDGRPVMTTAAHPRLFRPQV